MLLSCGTRKIHERDHEKRQGGQAQQVAGNIRVLRTVVEIADPCERLGYRDKVKDQQEAIKSTQWRKNTKSTDRRWVVAEWWGCRSLFLTLQEERSSQLHKEWKCEIKVTAEQLQLFFQYATNPPLRKKTLQVCVRGVPLSVCAVIRD